MKQLFFIINPNAGNGSCLAIWKKLEDTLKTSESVPYLAFFTEYPGHAKTIASQIASKNLEPKLIIAVGGDGTAHEVMNGLMKFEHVTLGFIPGGSGNDFSRGFHIPRAPEEALKVILRLRKMEGHRIDIGKIDLENPVYFINNMGAGFDALISYKVNQSKVKALLNKYKMGRLVYVYFLIKELFTFQTTKIDLSIDGHKHIFEKTWFVTVSNQPFYGGGMKIAPSAIPNDGLFDITVVHNLSRLKLLLVFISVFWGKHVHFKEVKTFTGKEVSIQTDTPKFVHADGEHIGYTPFTINMMASSLPLLTRMWRKEEVDLKERGLNDFH